MPEDLAALRLHPKRVLADPLPANFLRHADDQTVAGLAAVFQAIDSQGLAATSFGDWGALAAPRFLGRVTLAHAIQRFVAEGAWGISPHLIPHRSLHALSGTVSQALKLHGPNFGVGGGPDAAAEIVVAAAALIAEGKLPGAWAVFTGWDPEPVPTREGRSSAASVCTAVALALVPARSGHQGMRLRILAGADRSDPGKAAGQGPFTLEALQTLLANRDEKPMTAVWQLGCGGSLEIEQPGTISALSGPHLLGGLAGALSRTGAGTENKP